MWEVLCATATLRRKDAMHEILVQGLGLTKNEAAAYMTLLKIGKAASGKIVHEAGISSGKIYETLSKLIDKGLVKVVVENGVKQFIANEPRTLLSYLQEQERALEQKQEALEKILPDLESLKHIDEKLETVSLVKGLRGISPLVYTALEGGKDITIMGLRSSKATAFNNFWKNWHRRRVELKKQARLLFTDKGSEYWRFFKELPHTTVREVPSLSPAALMIIDNETFIFSYEEELVCIHITSPGIANSFRSFFNGLWATAGKE